MNKSTSLIRITSLILLVFVAAFGGMYLGGKFGKNGESVDTVSAEIFQQLKLQPGVPFPKVALLDRAFNPVPNQVVLHNEGTVIIFMDPQCPPCKDLALYWQSLINGRILTEDQVVGICFFNASQIEEIYLNYGVSFPVYADETYEFYDKFGVDAFPLTIVVNKFGVITYSESNSNIRPSAKELKRLFSTN